MLYEIESAGVIEGHAAQQQTIYAKVTRRLLPFLFICNVLNWLDRANVSFAHLQLKQDLGFSEASFGLGVGLFFIGYILCEVPSNLLMKRIGARLTISRILILWGTVSALMMFVRTPAEFYIARVALGATEAGFLPGVILYLARWYPSARRARITALLLMATAIAGLVGGPISGYIMSQFHDLGGLRGWQWLFVLEGVPSVIIGIVALFYLSDGPAQANWLTAEEREQIIGNLRAEEAGKTATAPASFTRALRDPKLYLLALGYMAVPWSGSVINFWAPSIIHRAGAGGLSNVGLLSAIPFVIGAVCMSIVSRRSDKKLERRWHFAVMAFLAASGISLLPLAANSWMASVALLTIATSGYLGAFSLFWTIPPIYLSAESAAGGIAVVSSLGQLGGLAAPIVIGQAASITGSYAVGLYIVAAVVAFAALTILVGIPGTVLRERRP